MIHALLLLCLALPASAEALDPADFPVFPPEEVKLGQLLFYDKILSGNRNIACGTCHHPSFGSGDGLALGIGEGGIGLGPDRVAPDGEDRILKRIPRNAPGLWNLGHPSIRVMFHDGRAELTDYAHYEFDTPAGTWLPDGLDSLLAAQALFPMTSMAEMAGSTGENEVIGAVKDRIDRGWPIIAKRVRTVPEYGARFVEVYEHIETAEDVTIVDIGNALAAFMSTEFQSHDSPYDVFMRGGAPLPAEAEAGRQLFFGRAGCADCHSGPLFSDQAFHAMGVPGFGPGRTRLFDPMPRDMGRMGTTDALNDAYAFRTPSLRNVALTAPYGHNGAYPTLEGMIRHMADPVGMAAKWTPDMVSLPEVPWLAAVDFAIRNDRLEMDRQMRVAARPAVALSDREVSHIEAFLNSLTGVSATSLSLGVPATVPSGLPVD